MSNLAPSAILDLTGSELSQFHWLRNPLCTSVSNVSTFGHCAAKLLIDETNFLLDYRRCFQGRWRRMPIDTNSEAYWVNKISCILLRFVRANSIENRGQISHFLTIVKIRGETGEMSQWIKIKFGIHLIGSLSVAAEGEDRIKEGRNKPSTYVGRSMCICLLMSQAFTGGEVRCVQIRSIPCCADYWRLPTVCSRPHTETTVGQFTPQTSAPPPPKKSPGYTTPHILRPLVEWLFRSFAIRSSLCSEML